MKLHLPSVVAIVIASAAADPLPLCAQDAPRAARSVHLWYPAPDADIFYNEVTVERSVPGSYFSVCGFGHGYFGIQEIRSPEDKVVIFSVWDPGKQDDPDSVDPQKRVRVLHAGDGVRVSRFGNEGTGGKSMFPYDWKVGETYRFLVRATVSGSRTAFEGWFFLAEKGEWKHLVTFETITGGDPLRGLYSFVEDFRRNGESARQVRRARYENGWVRTTEGRWIALTKATFTADRTRSDAIDAGVVARGFFLQNGGDTESRTALRTTLERVPIGLVLPPPAEAPSTAGGGSGATSDEGEKDG